MLTGTIVWIHGMIIHYWPIFNKSTIFLKINTKNLYFQSYLEPIFLLNSCYCSPEIQTQNINSLHEEPKMPNKQAAAWILYKDLKDEGQC